MRDRVNTPTDGFESFHAPRLSPADGVESDASLFTAPPIESLEIMQELGEIAAESLREPTPVEAPVSRATETPVTSAAPAEAPRATPKSADERLTDALLEYHRLRGPKLGARTAPRPSGSFARVDASVVDPGERFSSIEIPIVQDFIPKTSPGSNRPSRPVQTILRPKPRS
jgi:hypothetical protein